jgi:hypothetical protein
LCDRGLAFGGAKRPDSQRRADVSGVAGGGLVAREHNNESLAGLIAAIAFVAAIIALIVIALPAFAL